MPQSLVITTSTSGIRPYAAPTKDRGEMPLYLTVPQVWRKKAQRVMLEMMLRHDDKSRDEIAAMIFVRGVETVLAESAPKPPSERLERRLSDSVKATSERRK
jgi:hypothetical protein